MRMAVQGIGANQTRLPASAIAFALAAGLGIAALSGGDTTPAADVGGERTVVTTEVVTAPPPAPEPPPATQPPPATPAPPGSVSVGEAHALNDQAFALMGEGRYAEALPLLQTAVAALGGAGPGDVYEAYASYNLGKTWLELGNCEEAVGPLRRSDQLQDRAELDQALAEAQACLAGDLPPPGRGRGKARGRAGGD